MRESLNRDAMKLRFDENRNATKLRFDENRDVLDERVVESPNPMNEETLRSMIRIGKGNTKSRAAEICPRMIYRLHDFEVHRAVLANEVIKKCDEFGKKEEMAKQLEDATKERDMLVADMEKVRWSYLQLQFESL
ncbi:hypothetical protein SESBI_38741 [Sesbania bispinosa]|nr:hypothetical protein SESBI_38741 [Sesbania bispinosa]